jgi:hypothetical protein
MLSIELLICSERVGESSFTDAGAVSGFGIVLEDGAVLLLIVSATVSCDSCTIVEGETFSPFWPFADVPGSRGLSGVLILSLVDAVPGSSASAGALTEVADVARCDGAGGEPGCGMGTKTIRSTSRLEYNSVPR